MNSTKVFLFYNHLWLNVTIFESKYILYIVAVKKKNLRTLEKLLVKRRIS